MRNDNIGLIQRILAGDGIAFEHLVRKYQKQVHTLAWRKIGDFHIAEDITQETFLQVYQKLETLEDPARFPSWLYVIADRLCIAWLRRNQRHTEPLEETDISEVETEAYSRHITTEHAKTLGEARRALVEALLAKLKEGNRAVITLHYLEGMTYAEISNVLGISENTVKSRLRRAREHLRQYEFMVPAALDFTLEAERCSQKLMNGGFRMKLTFQRDELLYPLQMLQGIASGQDTSPMPSNVLIRADGNTVECMATDTEIGIRMKVEGTVKEEGAITVSAQKLGDIVEGWPVEKPIDLATTTDGRVEITCGNDLYKIVELADEELPQLPSVDEGALAIDGETLRSVLYKTEFAASTEKKRRFLNGLYFNLFDDRTEVVGCDGKQIAIAQCEPFRLSKESDGFIVPLKAVREIERNFANSAEVRISLLKNEILFADEHATLTTRLVDAEYPKYEKVFPESAKMRTVVQKEPMLRAIQRISPFLDTKCPAVCLEIDEQQIRMSPRDSDPDEKHETLAVESSTGSIRIGFDTRLLIETLTRMETESLVMAFAGELKPMTVTPLGAEGHICLIMPMSLDWR